jgi:hypothetical protein
MTDELYLFTIRTPNGTFHNVLYDGDPDRYIFDTIKEDRVTVIGCITVSRDKWEKMIHEASLIDRRRGYRKDFSIGTKDTGKETQEVRTGDIHKKSSKGGKR